MRFVSSSLDRLTLAWAEQHGFRYLVGAVICALANNVVLIGGEAAGLPALAGVILAWLTGGTIGYLWHHTITFRERSSLRGYLQMMIGSAIAIPLAFAVIAVLQSQLGWSMWLAAPAATVAMFIYNYFNARLAILRRMWRTRRDNPASR